MEATFKVKLKPFTVPNYVLVDLPPGKREDGFTEGPKYRLEDLDPVTLEAMCDEFRDAVFGKAKKSRPPMVG
jgi:hypothetical protein